MIRIFWILAAAVTLLTASPAMAWGEYGHRTIANIADANISPATRARIRQLMHSEELLGTPECALKDIGDASVWPDCIRRDRLRWGYTSPWHYQNVDICEEFTLRGNCPGGNCVSAQIDRNAALLADSSLPRHVRLEALAFLVHFVGDLHMPLHAGDRSDRGGNDVSAAYGIVEGRMNLHWMWDGPLAERSITDGPDIVRIYSASERAEMSGGTSEDWSREAWRVARDFAYPTAEDGPSCEPITDARKMVDNDEIRMLVPVARQQVQRAGLRLARLLDDALSGN